MATPSSSSPAPAPALPPTLPTKPVPRTELPEVLAYIRAHFTADRDTILRDGQPISVSAPNSRGYFLVTIGRFDGQQVKWRRGRLRWFIANPDAPLPEVIDHVNGDKGDDRLANLRPATLVDNNRNRTRSARERARGLPRGVRRRVLKDGTVKFDALGAGRKKARLGTFDTVEKAEARAKADREKIAGAFLPKGTRYRRKTGRK